MDISVGAVGAAFVAGLVSLLGLILGKEQKTSEFRQAWIDALRAQLVSYATNINSIVDKVSAGFGSDQEKISALSTHYAELNKASFDIKLRINQEEDEPKIILSIMEDFEQLAKDEVNFTVSNIKPIEDRFVESSKRLLKYEWKRVKRGEGPFIFAKWTAIISTVAMAALTIWLLYGDSEKKQKIPSPSSTKLSVELQCKALEVSKSPPPCAKPR